MAEVEAGKPKLRGGPGAGKWSSPPAEIKAEGGHSGENTEGKDLRVFAGWRGVFVTVPSDLVSGRHVPSWLSRNWTFGLEG